MKTHNHKKGKAGEDLAIEYLKNAGYWICQRNYKKQSGEIDLIVRRNDTVIFVEVKYRENLNHGFPRESVNRKKQKRIAKTALWYLQEEALFDCAVRVRFDVIEIYFLSNGERVINHLENAFPF